MRAIQKLYDRDKNHPCVVMWSLANEPSSQDQTAVLYFRAVVDKIRSLDSRPVTIVESMP